MRHTIFTISYLFFLLIANAQVANKIEAIIQMGHAKAITASDISPDGKYLATGSIDRSIIIWEVKTGKEIRILHHHVKSINSISFSQDGKSILSASNDNTVKIANVETGAITHTFFHTKYDITNAYFNGDASRVIIFDKRQHFSVWNVFSGELIGYFTKDYAAYNDAKTVDFYGNKAAIKISSKEVGCISLSTLDTLFTMPFDKAHTLNFSANGKYIVIGSSKLFATVFDAKTGDSLHTVKTDKTLKCDGCKTKVAISPDSKYVYTMSNKGTGLVWEIKTGKIIQEFSTPKKSPNKILWNDNNKVLLLSFDGQIILYNIQSGRDIINYKNKAIENFEITLKAGRFIIPGPNYSADMWTISQKKVVKNFKGYLNQTQSDGLNYHYSNWIDQNILQYISFKTSLALNPNQLEIAIGKVDSSTIILHLKTGRIAYKLKDAHKANLCQAYSKNGNRLAIAGGDRKIRVYDTETFELMHTLSGHQELIFDLYYSNDENILVSGSWDGTIRTWDAENNKMLSYIELDKNSPYMVRYSPNDLYIVSGDLSKNIEFWETDTKEKFRTLVGHSGPISDIVFSNDGQQVLTSSWDGKIKLWHTLTGMQLAKFNDKGVPVYAVNFSKNKQEIISGDGDRCIKFWDIQSGKLIHKLSGHISAVTDIKITSDWQYMVSRGANGEVIIWDYTSKKQLYTYMQINQNDWLVTTPSGHFDGSKRALDLVNYVSGMQVIAISSLFDRYYTPGLAERIMNGEKINDTGDNNFQNLIKDRPSLAFQMPSSRARTTIVKNDSTVVSKLEVFTVDIATLENGEDIVEIKLYNNGKLIHTEQRGEALTFRGARPQTSSYDIKLVDGINQIKAIAVSKTKVESDPISLQIRFDGEAAKTDLYIFSIGINTYKNQNYNLSYAVKDAQDFSKAITKGGEALFNKVHTIAIEDQKANKTEIEAAFKRLISQVGPEDVFVFYYAGHGVMSLGTEKKPSDFYIVTHNVTSFFGEKILTQEGVSATELLNFSKKISAQKQLFILDACHSGGALNVLASRGGDGREKAIAQLARNTGTFFLTASQDAQYANESGDLKHGLFTYALLELIKGEVRNLNDINSDRKITINEMKTYVEERVPELSEKYHGSPQYPTSYSFGQDFPIVILK